MSLLGGLLGVGKSYIRQPKEGDEVRAAVNEIQGTEGVDGWGGPQKSTRSRALQTREAAGEVTRPCTPKCAPDVATVSWARTAPSPPARGSKAAPGSSNQGEQGLGSASTTPGLLTALALLLSFKPAHRTSLTDISLSEFNYGFT